MSGWIRIKCDPVGLIKLLDFCGEKLANKICRCTILSFMWDESHKGELYENDDLENGIQFCQEYIDAGYTHEYHDKFDLREYIEWAKLEIAKI